MKFGVVNKSTTVNRFVHHSLQRNIKHLALKHVKQTKNSVFERGNWKRAKNCSCGIMYLKSVVVVCSLVLSDTF